MGRHDGTYYWKVETGVSKLLRVVIKGPRLLGEQRRSRLGGDGSKSRSP